MRGLQVEVNPLRPGFIRQIRLRTCVAGLFPGEPSLLRLVSAVLLEISEEGGQDAPLCFLENQVTRRRFCGIL